MYFCYGQGNYLLIEITIYLGFFWSLTISYILIDICVYCVFQLFCISLEMLNHSYMIKIHFYPLIFFNLSYPCYLEVWSDLLSYPSRKPMIINQTTGNWFPFSLFRVVNEGDNADKELYKSLKIIFRGQSVTKEHTYLVFKLLL